MKLVVNANVLFSALLKDGTTRHLWTHPGLSLFAPSFIIEELLKYEKTMLEKSGIKPDEFKALLSGLLSTVALVPEKQFEAYMTAASTLNEDRKDWPYLALALKENAAIWSNDTDFKRQGRIPIYSTAELAQKIGKL